MDGDGGRRDTARVPGFILFSADDYKAAAQACRVAAAQADGDAKRQANPSMVKLFTDSANRYRELAEKFELAARVL
jgi:hypothetical protein